jgi:hypothetical protein
MRAARPATAANVSESVPIRGSRETREVDSHSACGRVGERLRHLAALLTAVRSDRRGSLRRWHDAAATGFGLHSSGNISVMTATDPDSAEPLDPPPTEPDERADPLEPTTSRPEPVPPFPDPDQQPRSTPA